jgi:hypothetical protein
MSASILSVRCAFPVNLAYGFARVSRIHVQPTLCPSLHLFFSCSVRIICIWIVFWTGSERLWIGKLRASLHFSLPIWSLKLNGQFGADGLEARPLSRMQSWLLRTRWHYDQCFRPFRMPENLLFFYVSCWRPIFISDWSCNLVLFTVLLLTDSFPLQFPNCLYALSSCMVGFHATSSWSSSRARRDDVNTFR